MYKVKRQVEEDFSLDPMMAICCPHEVDTQTKIEEANKEARECICNELGPKKASLNWEVCDKSRIIRIRAVYRDEANDARVVV